MIRSLMGRSNQVRLKGAFLCHPYFYRTDRPANRDACQVMNLLYGGLGRVAIDGRYVGDNVGTRTNIDHDRAVRR